MSKNINTRKAAETYTHTHTHTHTHGCLYKIIISVIFAIATIIPSYATNITASNKDCDHDNLSTYSGDATLEATCDANTVNITFYSDNTEYDTGTCQYDGTLTLPADDPEKDGYIFSGWKVRSAAPSNPQQTPFDLSTLNASTPGIWYASHSSTDYCYYYYYDESTEIEDEVDDDCSDSHVAGLSAKEWKTWFSYGTVKGTSLCSTTPGSNGWYTNGVWDNNGNWNNTTKLSTLTDETGEEGARYCWCKPTGYDSGNTGNYSPVASSSWVFFSAYGNAGNCANDCAAFCADGVQGYSGFRAAVFGVSQ